MRISALSESEGKSEMNSGPRNTIIMRDALINIVMQTRYRFLLGEDLELDDPLVLVFKEGEYSYELLALTFILDGVVSSDGLVVVFLLAVGAIGYCIVYCI